MTRLRRIVESTLAVLFALVTLCILAVGAGVLVGFGAIGYRLMVGP